MKVYFAKIKKVAKFQISSGSVLLQGSYLKESENLVKIEAILSGKLDVICCKSGDTFQKDIDNKLTIYASNGSYDGQYAIDTIEFYDSYIDFAYILDGEIESIKSDYNIKNHKGDL